MTSFMNFTNRYEIGLSDIPIVGAQSLRFYFLKRLRANKEIDYAVGEKI